MSFIFGRPYHKILGSNIDPGFFMPIARRIAARLISNDIVSVQAMVPPRGQLLYIDFHITGKPTFKFGRIWTQY